LAFGQFTLSAESFFLSETGVSRGTPVSVITAGSDLDCPSAPRQKKLAAFRFPGSEKPGKLHSAPSFFLSKSEDSRGSSDLVLNEGSNLEAPLGPPVSCFQQGTRIIIESPGGAFIDQFKTGRFLYLRRSPARRKCMRVPPRQKKLAAFRFMGLLPDLAAAPVSYNAYISGERNFAVWPTNLVENFSALMVSGVTALHFSRVFWKSASISGMQSVLYR